MPTHTKTPTTNHLIVASVLSCFFHGCGQSTYTDGVSKAPPAIQTDQTTLEADAEPAEKPGGSDRAAPIDRLEPTKRTESATENIPFIVEAEDPSNPAEIEINHCYSACIKAGANELACRRRCRIDTPAEQTSSDCTQQCATASRTNAMVCIDTNKDTQQCNTDAQLNLKTCIQACEITDQPHNNDIGTSCDEQCYRATGNSVACRIRCVQRARMKNTQP